jgi:FkbM family methyltransferase
VLRRVRPVDVFPAEVAAQQELVGRDARVVLDVGAGYGETVGIYLRAFPSGSIFAFEPTPDAAAELRVRYATEPVEVIAAAVGAVPGTASLRVNRFQPTSSLLATAATGSSFWGDGLLETEAVLTVSLVTLDDFCEERRLKTVDLLKIDVQGAERQVLEGARGLLERRAVRALYFEVLMVETYEGQATLVEYLDFLRSVDYVPAGFYGQVIRNGRLLSFDMLARPS